MSLCVAIWLYMKIFLQIWERYQNIRTTYSLISIRGNNISSQSGYSLCVGKRSVCCYYDEFHLNQRRSFHIIKNDLCSFYVALEKENFGIRMHFVCLLVLFLITIYNLFYFKLKYHLINILNSISSTRLLVEADTCTKMCFRTVFWHETSIWY